MKEAVYTPGKSCGLLRFGNMASNCSDHFSDAFQLYFKVGTFFVTPLCLLGLPGNIIAFCIFGQIGRQNSTTFLMRALAVIDSCVLLFQMTYNMVSPLQETLCGVYQNDEKCHLALFSLWMIGQTKSMISMACIWTSVIIGMNRYIAVCWPLHATRICTINNARKQMLGVILGSVAFSLPGFFETKLEKAPHSSSYLVKYPLIDNDWYFYTYKVGCTITFTFLIPFGLCLFFTARLVATLRLAREQPISRHGGRQMDTNVTNMLVVVMAVFLVSYIPHSVGRFLHFFSRIGFNITSMIIYFSIISIILLPLNSSLNIFIYLVYLKDFRRIMCGRCSRRPPHDEQYELS